VKRANNEAAKYRVRLREVEGEVEQLRQAAMSEQERAVAEAYDRGRSEERAEWEPRVQEAMVRSIAAPLVRDPEDVVAMLSWDGDDTEDSIKAKVAALLEAKPYLALTSEPPTPIAQGTRGGGTTQGDAEGWLRDQLGR